MTASVAGRQAGRERDRSVDVLRGIGIIVIIMGHIDYSGVGGEWVTYLYSFNVALFFTVSGYMWSSPRRSYVRTVVRKSRQILLPYAVLFTVSLLYGHIVVRYIFNQPVAAFDLRQTLKALLYSSDWLNTVPAFNFALWFLPIFFIASALFPLMQKITSLWLYVPTVLIVAASAIPLQQWLPGRPPLAINVLPVALGFMGAGYLIRRWVNVRRLKLPVVAALLLVGLFIAYSAPGNVAGINSLWYYPGAIASFIAYLRISQDLESSALLSYVGVNSLVIFGVHGLVANTYSYSGVPSWFTGWGGLVMYAINIGYILMISVGIVWSYRWIAAWLRNARRTQGWQSLTRRSPAPVS